MLRVDTKKCTSDAPICASSQIQYELGILLACIGLGEITQQNLKEYKVRAALYTRLIGRPQDLDVWLRYGTQSVGVAVNVTLETRKKFVARLIENVTRDLAYACERDDENYAPSTVTAAAE